MPADNRYNLTNPDGIQFDIGYDFVGAALGSADGTPGNQTQESGASRGGRGAPRNPLGLVAQMVKKLFWGR